MPAARFSLEQQVAGYYQAGQEADRLESPFFRWEKARTLDILDRFLPPAPALILDVGGAAGAYAFPLAEQGYTVDLIDPVALHIEQAKQRAASVQRAPRNFLVGDARAIPCNDGAADAVLFFGPLYHLTDSSERLNAIREAHRVLRAGGVLLAVAISRFASALDGIGRGLIRDPAFVRILEQDLKTGQHRNDTANPDYFTTAFFHHPDELKMELNAGGFPSPKLCAIEGPIWTVPEWAAEQQDQLMATVRAIENEATLIGASAHIMGIATKPNN
ncbi:MAG TPA: class I SAM-dependent methyltransferase [Bryobacteraceae bacterium]|jgi:SAM-dependent methyltransferase|nr:class I SAM-dependent methyltransferase [Bryobacteraceae bacterium]